MRASPQILRYVLSVVSTLVLVTLMFPATASTGSCPAGDTIVGADCRERCKRQCDKIHDRCHEDCRKNEPTGSCHHECNKEYSKCLRECDRDCK
jgi:hypothetical protein